MKLNVVGQVFGTSGYAIHTTNLIRALKKLGVDISLETGPFPNWEFSEFKPEIEKSMKGDYIYENTLMIVTPEWLSIKSGDRIKLCGYGVFEGTCVPPYWVEVVNKNFVYKIICPSKHTKQAWMNGGCNPDKLVVIPHGYNPDIFKPEGTKKYNDDVYRFLFVGGWRNGQLDRKRVDVLVKAYCAEFKPDEKVELLLKFNMAYQDQNMIINNLNALGLPEVRPKIALSFDTLDDEHLAELYRSCQCFVCPTAGESFNMPNLEAMACGIPSISTNFGGQTDYLPKEWLIEIASMIPATGEGWIYDWAEWAVPDQSHLQILMRKAFSGMFKGKPELVKDYTWEETGKKIIKLFE